MTTLLILTLGLVAATSATFPHLTCSNLRCMVNYTCIQNNRDRPECIPNVLSNGAPNPCLDVSICPGEECFPDPKNCLTTPCPQHDCRPFSCPEHETFEMCGTQCPTTCANRDNPPQACKLSCRVGCDCVEGMMRNDKGVCVTEDECPSSENQCPPHQAWTDCGTSCPETCASIADPSPRMCTMQCVSGCFCEDGYVKNANDECVKREDCV